MKNDLNKFQFKIVFGIGSNLGDRKNNIKIAVDKLIKSLFLSKTKTSNIFKNPAMLLANSPEEWNLEFYNIALSAVININEFPPFKILEIIKNIEKEIGRNPSMKWAPREIDIDILAIDEIFFNDKDILTIPHQGLLEREFFYKTMQEIEPELLSIIENKMISKK